MTKTFEQLETRRLMANFTVTTNADTGPGSLRDAITQANATTAADVINFNIAGTGVKTIFLGSPLDVTQPLTIDATTQPGYAGIPRIQINGNDTAAYGLDLNGANSVLRGVSITGMGRLLTAGDGVGLFVRKPNIVVEKCWIGMAPGGNIDANEAEGIRIHSPATSAILRDNYIAGNEDIGVNCFADNVRFTGNHIGVLPNGYAAGNTRGGILFNGSDNVTFGDVGAANRNYVAGNSSFGLKFVGSTNGLLVNNYFNLSDDGIAGVAIPHPGLVLEGSSGFHIGVAGAGNRFGGAGVQLNAGSLTNEITENVFNISTAVDPASSMTPSVAVDVANSNLNVITNNLIGNQINGIYLVGSNNLVSGNRIGVMPDGYPVGGNVGVVISGSNNDVVNNVIANQTSYGVSVFGGHDNTIDNSTYANGQSVYIDTGDNDFILAPSITQLQAQPDGTYRATVVYGGNIAPAGNYRVSFYESDAAGNPSSGHTQRLLFTEDLIYGGSPTQRQYTVQGSPTAGKYLTAVLTEYNASLGLDSTGKVSAAVQFTGTPAATPVLSSSSFGFEARQECNFTFNSVNASSVSVSDLVIRNRDTMQTYSANGMFELAPNSFSFWRNTNALLPDGRYEAVIPAGAVSNSAGANTVDLKFNFNVLAGDATRDGTVNFDDLLRVAQSYGQTGKTFSQGDFNYDSKVDFLDLLTLAQRFGTSLFSTAPIGATSGGRSLNADLLD